MEMFENKELTNAVTQSIKVYGQGDLRRFLKHGDTKQYTGERGTTWIWIRALETGLDMSA
jgi:hypothetical protein